MSRVLQAAVHTCAAALVVLALVPGCGGDDQPPRPRETLRILAGSPGGVYLEYGRGLGRVVDRYGPPMGARVIASDGSVENLRRLASGRADMAFALADSAGDAVAGRGPFRRRSDLVALARLYDDYVQVFVRTSDGPRKLSGLAGRRVSVGPPGSGTRLIAERILTLAGLSGARAVRPLSLDIAQAADALASGRIDAFFWSGGLPASAITKLRRRVLFSVLDLSGMAARLRARYGDLYSETRLPRGIYYLPRAVTTVSVPNLLVVRRDLDPEIAYRVTRLLFEHRGVLEAAHPEARHLNLRAAIATFPLDLHPGAVRWYREAHP